MQAQLECIIIKRGDDGNTNQYKDGTSIATQTQTMMAIRATVLDKIIGA